MVNYWNWYLCTPEGSGYPPGTILKLKKALYGLVQAARAWYISFCKILKSLGLRRSRADPCAFIRDLGGGDMVIVIAHVDDCIVTGPEAEVYKLAEEIKLKIWCTSWRIRKIAC